MNKIIEGILKNDIAAVDEARRETPRLPNVRVKGLTAVYYAAEYAGLEVNRFMVEKTMSKLNMLDDKKRSVLFYAVKGGDLEVCRYYVERVGHSPLTADIDGITAFEYAKELGREDIVKYFEEYCGFKYGEGYKNPVRRGFYPDPSVVRVGEDYYMVNSTFVYFPCIPVSHSKDLVNWQVIGHALTNPDWAELEGLEGGRGYWAPDISYYKGRFYICATYRNNDNERLVRRQMVTSAEKPEGPYDKPVFIDVDGIDPSIFTDTDGSRYMLLNRGASIFKLSEDGKKRVSEVSLLYYGDNKRAPEGPHLLKKDGWYYLFQAEGGTGAGHMISVSRSRELFGLYEPCPFNPIMTYKELHNPCIRRCGHGKPVMTPDGRWFIVYLCGRLLEGKYTVLGRETCLDELVWTSDGWPVINKGRGPSSFAKYPLKKQPLESTSDEDFDGKEIPGVWYSLRGRDRNTFEMKNSRLIINGGRDGLESTACKSVLLRRQESFDFTAEAKTNTYLREEGSAGLTCYYDENSFFTFGLKRERGKIFAEVREKIADEYKLSFREEFFGEVCDFKIDTKGLKRDLYINGRLVYTIGDSSYLSDEGVELGKRFTGAMTGMYCTGEGSRAEFDFFKMK